MGNWDEATRHLLDTLIETLICPKCSQQNRHGVLPIEFDSHLLAAHCSTCSHAWIVEPALTGKVKKPPSAAA